MVPLIAGAQRRQRAIAKADRLLLASIRRVKAESVEGTESDSIEQE